MAYPNPNKMDTEMVFRTYLAILVELLEKGMNEASSVNAQWGAWVAAGVLVEFLEKNDPEYVNYLSEDERMLVEVVAPRKLELFKEAAYDKSLSTIR